MQELNINCPATAFFSLHPDGPPARALIQRLVSITESHVGNDSSAKIASEQPTPKAMEDDVMVTVCVLEHLNYSIPI